MGNKESSSAEPSEEVAVSHEAHYKELFAELSAPDHTGKPADQKIFRVSLRVVCGEIDASWCMDSSRWMHP